MGTYITTATDYDNSVRDNKKTFTTNHTGSDNLSIIGSNNNVTVDGRYAANLAADTTKKMAELAKHALDSQEQRAAKQTSEYKQMANAAINSVKTSVNSAIAKLTGAASGDTQAAQNVAYLVGGTFAIWGIVNIYRGTGKPSLLNNRLIGMP